MARSLLGHWSIRTGTPAALLAVLLAGHLLSPRPSFEELAVIDVMEDECHIVWKELLGQRIVAGDDVEEVIARTHPSIIRRAGDSVVLYFYQDYRPGQLYWTGVSIEAEQGKLVAASAGSCGWDRQFFGDFEAENRESLFTYHRLPQGGAIGY